MDWKDIALFNKRATEWKSNHQDFLSNRNQAFAKIFYLTSGNSNYLVDKPENWKLIKERPTVFHWIYVTLAENKHQIGISEALTILLSAESTPIHIREEIKLAMNKQAASIWRAAKTPEKENKPPESPKPQSSKEEELAQGNPNESDPAQRNPNESDPESLNDDESDEEVTSIINITNIIQFILFQKK